MWEAGVRGGAGRMIVIITSPNAAKPATATKLSIVA
jgi:hypothetical protein